MISARLFLAAFVAGFAAFACGGGGEERDEPAFDLETAQVWIATAPPTEDGIGPVHFYEPFTGEVRLLGAPAMWASPAWSPDGSRIALSDLSPDDHLDLVVLRTEDGNELGRFSLEAGIEGFPRSDWPLWSAVGTRLAVVSAEAVYVFDSDGSLLVEFRLEEPSGSYGPAASWSPDSRFFLGLFENRAAVLDRAGRAAVHEFPFANPAKDSQADEGSAVLFALGWNSANRAVVSELVSAPPQGLFELVIEDHETVD